MINGMCKRRVIDSPLSWRKNGLRGFMPEDMGKIKIKCEKLGEGAKDCA
jgi:hypothetical protein